MRNASSASTRSRVVSQPSCGESPTRIAQASSQSRVVPGRTAQARPGVASSPRRDDEQVGRRRLGQEAVHGQEQGVVGARVPCLDPSVDVLGATGRLECGERVLRVSSDDAGYEVQPALEVVGRRRRHGPGLHDHGRHRQLAVRQQAASDDRPAADGDPDRGVTLGPVEPFGLEESGTAPVSRASISSTGGWPARRRSVGVGRRVRPARSGDHHERGASRRPHRPAGNRDRRRRGGAHRRVGRARRPRRGAGSCCSRLDYQALAGRVLLRAATRSLTRRPGASADLATRSSDAESGPLALATVSSYSSAGTLLHVMPPPTWRVSRRPSATKVRMRIDEPIAPSGPIQSERPYRAPDEPARAPR